ncbi:Sodium/calcium exchanger 2, partial [Lamellibrachia satsuma]
MVVYHYTNYSNGWVVEVLGDSQDQCDSYLLLPAENLWSRGVRGFLYILALLYLFMGVAIVSDIFMFAIEVITSKRKTIIKWDEETHERVSKEVLVWNETVANLTLMALGSSAPEILLAVIETLQTLDKEADDGGLGTFTIIGSAAFNLLIITAVCVYAVPSPDIKQVRGLGVFALTSCWSIFAYIWMLIVLQWISPGKIEPWEAWLTLAFFPIMVLTAYCQDLNWWCLTRK